MTRVKDAVITVAVYILKYLFHCSEQIRLDIFMWQTIHTKCQAFLDTIWMALFGVSLSLNNSKCCLIFFFSYLQIYQLNKQLHLTQDMAKHDLKAPYSSKLDIFFIQEGFNKLIYGINTIIKCGI